MICYVSSIRTVKTALRKVSCTRKGPETSNTGIYRTVEETRNALTEYEAKLATAEGLRGRGLRMHVL